MTNTAQPAPSLHRNVVPSEVGWQFVPQYYTFVNKQPDRLHCFYTKRSTFIHGTEGEDGKPCHGQQEIHQKITSLGFENCKVFIHSVDAQSSADGGIIIQVIGEMSNRGEDWRKFVQTFFLAEQPNGYFVLNDIFRFLKEDAVDDEQADESNVAAQAEPVTPEQHPAEAAPEPAPSPAPVPSFIAPQTPTPAEPIPIEEPTTVAELTEPEPPVVTEPARVNGVNHAQEPEKPRVATPTPAPVPTTASPAPPVEKTRSPAPPVASTATPPPQQPAVPPAAPAQAPAAPRPTAPKTWANLAAANPKKWGSAVAQESRGTTEVIPPSQAPAVQPQTPVPAPASNVASGNGQRPHQALINAQTITTAQCFIKGVVEGVTQQTLSNVLTTRFGPIKELEIVRSKACAFGEFTTIEAARKAIIASLYPAQGGEGGIWVDLVEGGQTRIVVDTKKERGDRPPSRPRGGAPVQGGNGPQGGNVNTGGSFRGRGRGRGGPPGK